MLNFWYACEFSTAVTNQPKQIVMLNQRFVLYRNSQAQVVLKDQCPHRAALLGEKVTVSVVPIMDGNPSDALTFCQCT